MRNGIQRLYDNLALFADGGGGNAKKDGEDDDLQDIVIAQGYEDVMGNDMTDKGLESYGCGLDTRGRG